MNPKNIFIPKKVPPITQSGIADINKRNFIKKGILGLAAGIGIAAFSKITRASGYIKFSDDTEQSTAATGGGDDDYAQKMAWLGL